MKLSRNLAIIIGLITPLLETIRRWSTWKEDPPSLFDDYILGGLLLYGAWKVSKDAVEGQRYLVLGWAVAFGMAFGGFFGQLRFVSNGGADPAPVPIVWVAVVKGLGLAVIILALILSLRRQRKSGSLHKSL